MYQIDKIHNKIYQKITQEYESLSLASNTHGIQLTYL